MQESVGVGTDQFWGVGIVILTSAYIQVGWGDLCFIKPKNIPDYSKSVQELLPIDAETRQKTIHDSSEADCLHREQFRV